MATLTVRNLPDELARKLKRLAKEHDCSMEQEVRNILQEKLQSRSELLERLERRAGRLPAPKSAEITGWVAEGRNRKPA